MRFRAPIAGLFLVSCGVATWLGLSEQSPVPSNRDKLAHVAVFFVTTVLFYWSIDTPRKRAVNITLVVCCALGAVGSEFLQHVATRAQRRFDLHDIAANLVGSLFATVLSSLYHGRLTERRRRARYERLRADLEESAPSTSSPEATPAADVDVELTQLEPEPQE